MNQEKLTNKIYSSFRDPSGVVYEQEGKIYRKIFPSYFNQFDKFIKSGLYDELLQKNYIIKHDEIEKNDDYIVLNVNRIPFISYPYEWCFDELKDAALLTLKIMKISLKYDMVLKDASSYNIQFLNGTPVFIDTLSFDFYKENTPWGAYGQFCRHFMAPLLLMSFVDSKSNIMLRDFIDGIPLDFANNLLNNRGKLVSKMHIKWHSKAIEKYNNDDSTNVKKVKIDKKSIENLIDLMIRQIEGLKIKESASEWNDYYNNTNYDNDSASSKASLVEKYLNKLSINENDIVFDIGSNDGKYSKIALEKNSMVISMDYDHNCINRLYLTNKTNKIKNDLPLLLDFTNPSPAIGFANKERESLVGRSDAKCIMALAVIHHICISNNVTFDMLASWLASMGNSIIIEFVPKNDTKVEKLLKTREDIFPWYTEKDFEKCFEKYFKLIEKNNIENSRRVLYLYEKIVK